MRPEEEQGNTTHKKRGLDGDLGILPVGGEVA